MTAQLPTRRKTHRDHISVVLGPRLHAKRQPLCAHSTQTKGDKSARVLSAARSKRLFPAPGYIFRFYESYIKKKFCLSIDRSFDSCGDGGVVVVSDTL